MSHSHHVLPRSFFETDAVTLAPKLLGKVVKKGPCEGIIVEVEAYAGDAASHALKKRNQAHSMRENWGHWYVYFTYGMHWCANVTCDKKSAGAVLIRAVEPTKGLSGMKKHRATYDIRKLTTGPACFTQAFGIGKKENGLPLSEDFGIFDAPLIPAAQIVASPRIGIHHATDLPWRFYIKGNPFVSKLPRTETVVPKSP